MATSQKSNDKYRRILDAAIQVFARNGFYNSKVSEIAKLAKVADGTIYLYFKNKDDILIKLFEDKMTLIIAELEERMAGVDDPLEKIRIFIRSHFEMVRDYPDMAEVITVELRQSTKFMKEYDNRKFAEYLNVLSSVVREGKDRGVIRDDVRPGIFKRSLFGMMDELSLYHVLAGERHKYTADEFAAWLGDFVIRGLTAPDKKN